MRCIQDADSQGCSRIHENSVLAKPPKSHEFGDIEMFMKAFLMDISPWWIAGGVAALGVAGVACAWKPLQRRRVRLDAEHARKSFRLQRELLEAKFFTLASSLGKPRGLRWLDCQWHDEVIFARDKQTGLITAFAGVSLRFEAIEGSDMEDVAAVSSLRNASALFHYQLGKWGTGGRALFNMDPPTAITRLQDQYEPLDSQVAVSSK
jgi:hypothetical protein